MMKITDEAKKVINGALTKKRQMECVCVPADLVVENRCDLNW